MTAAAYAAYRTRVVSDTVATASPARLVTMLYDRLVLDLDRAESAQRAGDRSEASAQLLHAQDIVVELASRLRPEVWDGGPGLAALYSYLQIELVGANVSADPDRTKGCRALVEPLRDAWHAAAQQVAAEGGALDQAGVG
jgi:flagellar protein FliS